MNVFSDCAETYSKSCGLAVSSQASLAIQEDDLGRLQHFLASSAITRHSDTGIHRIGKDLELESPLTIAIVEWTC